MHWQTLIPQVFTGALGLLMLRVIYTDTVRYTISNLLNLTVLFLFGVAVFFLPIHAVSALAAAGIVLAVGIVLFALGLMGGGDVKLLTVLVLWTGWDLASVHLVFLTAIAGGGLVIIVLLLRILLPPLLFRANPTRPIPRIFLRKQPVPYGIAIAAAFLWMLGMGSVPPLAH